MLKSRKTLTQPGMEKKGMSSNRLSSSLVSVFSIFLSASCSPADVEHDH